MNNRIDPPESANSLTSEGLKDEEGIRSILNQIEQLENNYKSNEKSMKTAFFCLNQKTKEDFVWILENKPKGVLVLEIPTEKEGKTFRIRIHKFSEDKHEYLLYFLDWNDSFYYNNVNFCFKFFSSALGKKKEKKFRGGKR